MEIFIGVIGILNAAGALARLFMLGRGEAGYTVSRGNMVFETVTSSVIAAAALYLLV